MPPVPHRHCRRRNEHRHPVVVGRGTGLSARARWIFWQACLLMRPVSARFSPPWRCRSLFSFPRLMNRRKRQLSYKAQARCWCGRARRNRARAISRPRSRGAQSKAQRTAPIIRKNMPLAHRTLHSSPHPREMPAANPSHPRLKRGGSSKRNTPAAGPISKAQALKAGFSVTPTDRSRIGARNLQA
jgi:hypothetical protein